MSNNNTSSTRDLVKFSLTNTKKTSGFRLTLAIIMRPELVGKLWGNQYNTNPGTVMRADFKMLDDDTLFLYPHVTGTLKFTKQGSRSTNYRATKQPSLVSKHIKKHKMQCHTGTHINFVTKGGLHGITVKLPEQFLNPPKEKLATPIPLPFDVEEDVKSRLVDQVEEGMLRLYAEHGILMHGRVKFEDAGDANLAWFEPLGLGKPSATIERVGSYARTRPAARTVPVRD